MTWDIASLKRQSAPALVELKADEVETLWKDLASDDAAVAYRAIVKLAAARANTDVGAMERETLAAIEQACQAVLAGRYAAFRAAFVERWESGEYLAPVA